MKTIRINGKTVKPQNFQIKKIVANCILNSKLMMTIPN